MRLSRDDTKESRNRAFSFSPLLDFDISKAMPILLEGHEHVVKAWRHAEKEAAAYRGS